MLKIAAVAREFEVLDDLPADLRDRLRQRYGLNVRRINRYMALALCGALRCRDAAGGIAPDAALYLACDLPMGADTVRVLQGIYDHGRPPSPFEFMNLVGNMAGFCIGEQLGLRGPQLSLSRNGAGLHAALELLSLHSAPHRRALIGYVDEGLWPLHEHRQRLHVSKDTALSECSHWLYVDADCEHPVAVIENCKRYRSEPEACKALKGMPAETRLALGTGFTANSDASWLQALGLAALFTDEAAGAGIHSLGPTAQTVIRFIQNQQEASLLLHLARSNDGSVHALRVRRTTAT